ncbi:MAG: IclR family transcriptional regulator [Actinomycetota bacterium]
MSGEMRTSLRRGLAVLLALGSEEAAAAGGLTVTQATVVTGREKSQISRTLKTLAELGLVDRDPSTLAYRLGWHLLALAAHAGDQRLLEAAGPLLARLVSDLGEGAHLSVLQGSEVLTVLSRPSAQAVQAVGWVGRTVPAYCTSSGRALLLDHDIEGLRSIWPQRRLGRAGPRSPRDIAELHERIVHARARGFTEVDEELEPGLVAVAAPVRDARGRIVAAVDVSAPKFRFEDRLVPTGKKVMAAAAALSHLVDWGSGRSRGLQRAGI